MADAPKVCARCMGTGFLPVEGDDMTVQQCICAYSRALKLHLGAEIATAPNITQSPLFMAGASGEPPKLDRTKENLFLKGYWTDLLPHFKWALGCKGPTFRYRIVTDEKLKTVYVGAESYATRAKGRRDEIVTYNSLSDLVGPDLDLVIIRLGFLGHKNVAMPGVLKESLMIREFACKATWIVEVPTSIFGHGHFSYSEEVAEYIENNFEVVNLTRKESARSDEVPHGIAIPQLLIASTIGEETDVGLGVHSSPEMDPVVLPAAAMQHMPKPRFDSPVSLDLPGSNRKSYAGKKSKKSGGPV